MFQDLCRQQRLWNYLYEIVSLFLKNGKYTSTTFVACLIVNIAVYSRGHVLYHPTFDLFRKKTGVLCEHP